jgi:hypothetical protein
MKNFENFRLSNAGKRFLTIVIGMILFFALAGLGKLFAQDKTIKGDTLLADISKKEIRLSSAYLTYGRGVLCTGADMTLDFAWNKNRILYLKGNNDRALVNVGKSFGNFKAILSFGVYKNVPCIAPLFKYTYKCITLTSWNGVAFGKNAELTGPGVSPRFFFSYQTVDVTFGKNCAGYILFYKTVAPANHFLFYRRTVTINKQAYFTFEATYNYREDIPMFVIGYKHSFLK